MYRLLDLGASSPDPAGLKKKKRDCQSFRFGTGTELSHLMRDRVEFWLGMGLYTPLTQRFYCLRPVIRRHGTPDDLRWIIVNLNAYLWAAPLAGRHEDGGMRRWTRKIKRKLNESGRRASPPFHVAVVSSGWQFCVFGFPFFFFFFFFFIFFFSPFLLLSFLPNSSFPLFRMITSPKNVSLQVFNTLGFEARSKWLLCLCFVVLNASCIKSPPGPRVVCFIFSKNSIYILEEEVLFCTAEAVEGLGIFTQVFNAILIAPWHFKYRFLLLLEQFPSAYIIRLETGADWKRAGCFFVTSNNR